MPYFFLPPEDLSFPPAHFADLDGLLAQGGDISASWLSLGYRSGIYLWASPTEPLKWWSPDPRVVIFPEKIGNPPAIGLHQSSSIIYDCPVKECLNYCMKLENAKPMNPAWVTGQFGLAYEALEKMGMVHTCLLRDGEDISACTIGARIGKVFFGEYMCGQTDASLLHLSHLFIKHLGENGVQMVDIDKESNRYPDIGISEISRSEYLDLLRRWID